MGRLFLWYYCLPIWQAVLLILVPTGLFRHLRSRLAQRNFWRPTAAVFLLLWMSMILLRTLGNRSSSEPLTPQLIPFYSYRLAAAGARELYREKFMNTVLFYPAGLLANELWPKTSKNWVKITVTMVIFLLASIGIEYCQYRFALGLAETDDVIHNVLGILFGMLAGFYPHVTRSKKTHISK